MTETYFEGRTTKKVSTSSKASTQFAFKQLRASFKSPLNGRGKATTAPSQSADALSDPTPSVTPTPGQSRQSNPSPIHMASLDHEFDEHSECHTLLSSVNLGMKRLSFACMTRICCGDDFTVVVPPVNPRSSKDEKPARDTVMTQFKRVYLEGRSHLTSEERSECWPCELNRCTITRDGQAYH